MTKLVNELYADVYSKVYDFHSIGLDTLIFWSKTKSNNPYAAVIPIFYKAFIDDCSPLINGDGETSRDFTFVENAVQANIKAMLIPSLNMSDERYVDQITLNQIIDLLRNISCKSIKTLHGAERLGDIRHSKANITKIKNAIGYDPVIRFKEGLEIVYNWYKKYI